MADEKENFENIDDYRLTTTVDNDKLSIRLLQKQNKEMFQQSFTAVDLLKCGFNKKQASNFETIKKLIGMAMRKEDGFECSVKRYNHKDTEGKAVTFATLLISKDHDIYPMEIELKLPRTKREKIDIVNDHIDDLKMENLSLKEELERTKTQLTNTETTVNALIQRVKALEDKSNENEMQTIDLALQNNWKVFGNVWDMPKAFKIGKVVYLKGLVTGGANHSTITTLPDGWRPSKQRLFCSTQHGGKSVRLDIRTNGTIYPETVTNGWVPFDGIQFVIE